MQFNLLLFMWLAPCLVAAQPDSTLPCNETKQVEILIDSLTKNLEGQKKAVVLFISVDFQGQKAYGCVLEKKNTEITGEKLFISENKVIKSRIDYHLLSINQRLFIDFFDNPNLYLMPPFIEENKREISHDNRMFFLAKVNGHILIKKRFCRSHYLPSKNEKIKLLFLKLGDIAD